MRGEIIQVVACDNYDGFQHLVSYFFAFLYFKVISDKTHPTVKEV